MNRSVVKGPINIQPPEKTATPYGGRLTWIMPGHTRMVVHLKDKNRMRHRKRWSQVLLFYVSLWHALIKTLTLISDICFGSQLMSSVSRLNCFYCGEPQERQSQLLSIKSDKMCPVFHFSACTCITFWATNFLDPAKQTNT